MPEHEDEAVYLLPQTTVGNEKKGLALRSVRVWFAGRFAYASFCIFALAVTVFAYSLGKLYGAKTLDKNICTTPACIHASSEILHNLSKDYKRIDPCTNFEELVCGGWRDRHDLRSDQANAFTGTVMNEKAETLLRHVLEKPYRKDSNYSNFSRHQFYLSRLFKSNVAETAESIDEANFKKLKYAYDACMDITAIKERGVEPLMKIIHQALNLFPVTTWDSDKGTPLTIADHESLSEIFIFFESISITGLFDLDIGPDEKNPDVNVISVSPPYHIGLPSEDHYKDAAVLKNYTTILAQVLSNLDLDHQKDNVTSQPTVKAMKSYTPALTRMTSLAERVVEFEKKLSAASPDATDRNDIIKSYNLFTLEDAEILTPQIGLSKLIGRMKPPGSNAKNLVVVSPDYMKKLSEILNEEPKEILQTFFIWKCIQSFSLIVEAPELKPYTRFIKELQGKDPESIPERWRRCVGHVDKGLGWILSRFYVERAFSEKAKSIGDQMISDIKEIFIKKLRNSSWMDPIIVEKAVDKVHKITSKIGYPTKSPNILNPQSLNDFYASINITSTSFFDNVLLILRFEASRKWSLLAKPVDRDEWSMTVPTVNAYYNAPGNEIVFPAGIMQFPVFDADLPHYLNYGAFGSIAGHELSHAFDSTGRHFNENGSYADWWNNKTVSNFEQRAQCFIDQFSKYTIPGPDNKPLHVNGKLTLGENIADAGGISASFTVWKERQSNSPAPGLPGLEHFSAEQLFFVSYGNWWCGKSSRESAINQIHSDPHAPSWIRVLGTLENSRTFKESFKCRDKEPICELW